MTRTRTHEEFVKEVKRNTIKTPTMSKSILKTKKKDLHPSSKLMYIYIVARMAGRGVGIHIPYFSFTEHLQMSTASARKYLKELENKGWLHIERFSTAKGNCYEPLNNEIEFGHKKFLQSFLISPDLTHSQKIFLVSIVPYIKAYKNESVIMRTYKEMAEITGLSERSVAEQMRSLSKISVNKSKYKMIEKIRGGYLVDGGVIMHFTEEELMNLTDREEDFIVYKRNHQNNKNNNGATNRHEGYNLN